MNTNFTAIFEEKKPQLAGFSGYIMREDKKVASVYADRIVSMDPCAPIYILRTKDFEQWIRDRGADLNRSFMRTILKHFKIPTLDIETAVKAVHAASITDTFWIKGHNENISYKDVKFKADTYKKAALTGDPDIFELPRVNTPEITNIGSFNKGWQKKGSRWVLYKAGKPMEIFSELFTAKLGLALGLDMVVYNINDGFITCENFVLSKWCFEPAKSFIGQNTDYTTNVNIMSKLGLLKPYMDIIFMDAIVRNGDRHEFNYGFLTTKDRQIRLAPNFDNNMALFWNGVPKILTRQDVLVQDFIFAHFMVDYELPTITEVLIRDVFRATIKEYPVVIDENMVVKFCMNAYYQIVEAKNKKCGESKNKGGFINERQRLLVSTLNSRHITRAQYASIYSISGTTATQELEHLVRLGYLGKMGDGHSAYKYHVL